MHGNPLPLWIFPDLGGKKTFSLQVVLAFLPTALYLIIRNLMSVKSSSEAPGIAGWGWRDGRPRAGCFRLDSQV